MQANNMINAAQTEQDEFALDIQTTVYTTPASAPQGISRTTITGAARGGRTTITGGPARATGWVTATGGPRTTATG